MSGGELLLEVRSHGFPAPVVTEGVHRIKDDLVRNLRRAGFAPRQSAVGATCRRLVVLLRGLPRQPQGVTGRAPGSDPRTLLAAAVERALRNVRWPVTMVWGEDAAGASCGPWVRPISGIVALFDGELLPVSLFGVESSEVTVGHPVLSPEPFSVENADQLRRELLQRGIEVRLEERRRQVRELLEGEARRIGGRVRDDNALLELWTAGSEVPGVVAGRFDSQYLKLPREVLIASLREGHRAFVVMVEGEISSWFLAPMDRPDDPEGRVRQGNEWAVAALLEDVAFHWARDGYQPLAERRRRLDDISYATAGAHAQTLGTLGDRSRRVASLAGQYCDELGWSQEQEVAAEAADLLYADLTTELVRELPALRGVVGGLLAQEEGYPESVWQAIYDHALPSTGLSTRPRGRVGTVVALAHWVDLLAGWALLGELDEGRGREPRKVAADIVRLAVHADLPLDLHLAAARALRAYRGLEMDQVGEALHSLQPLIDRTLEEVLTAEGFTRDELRAVLAAAGASSVAEIVHRLRGLRLLRAEPRLREIVRSARRLNDVLSDAPEAELDPEQLREPSERELYRVSSEAGAQVHTLLRVGRLEDWLERMLEVDGALQAFFAQVLVRDQVEALRLNRLALLQILQRLYGGVVRLAELELPEDD